MKNLMLLLSVTSAMATMTANAATAENKDNSAVAEVILARNSVAVKDAKKVISFPNEVKCSDGILIQGLNTLEPEIKVDGVDTPGYPASVSTSPDSKTYLINAADGDQLPGAYEFARSDLEALQAGKVKSIAAISIEGFWWADGDHYTDSVVVCTK